MSKAVWYVSVLRVAGTKRRQCGCQLGVAFQVIGASIMLVTYLYGTEIDSWIVANEYALPLLFLGLVTFLLLSPQPRPRNPTFIQNCLLAGLIMGAATGSCLSRPASAAVFVYPLVVGAGSQLHHHQVGIVDGHWDFAFAPSWARFAGPITPVLGVLIRQVFGFSLVRLGGSRSTPGMLLTPCVLVPPGVDTPRHHQANPEHNCEGCVRCTSGQGKRQRSTWVGGLGVFVVWC